VGRSPQARSEMREWSEGLDAGAGFRFAHPGREASLRWRDAACAPSRPGVGRRKRVCWLAGTIEV